MGGGGGGGGVECESPGTRLVSHDKVSQYSFSCGPDTFPDIHDT